VFGKKNTIQKISLILYRIYRYSTPKEKIKGTLEDSFAMSSASNPLKVERKETSKGIKL